MQATQLQKRVHIFYIYILTALNLIILHNILKGFKKRIDFYLCSFGFDGKIVKLKIIKFFCLFIKTAFAAN